MLNNARTGNSPGHAAKSHCRRVHRCLLSGGIETIAGRRQTSFCAETTNRPFGGFVEGFRMRAAALRWGLVGTSARVGNPPEEETAGSCRGVAMGKAGWGG